MSCRKEWKLRVDSGFLIRVKGHRSEIIGVMNPVWTLQWRNHTRDDGEDSFTLKERWRGRDTVNTIKEKKWKEKGKKNLPQVFQDWTSSYEDELVFGSVHISCLHHRSVFWSNTISENNQIICWVTSGVACLILSITVVRPRDKKQTIIYLNSLFIIIQNHMPKPTPCVPRLLT